MQKVQTIKIMNYEIKKCKVLNSDSNLTSMRRVPSIRSRCFQFETPQLYPCLCWKKPRCAKLSKQQKEHHTTYVTNIVERAPESTESIAL
ncbi:hypothetical protein ACF0H5_011299 [Mactra antiquata]